MPALPDPKALGELDLFRGVSPTELARVNDRLGQTKFAAGATVLTATQPGEVAYVVLSGTLKVSVLQSNGRELTLAVLGPGEGVGELALTDRACRSADVVALEPSALLWIDRASFDQLRRDIPAITENLIRLMARRVRLANAQLQAMATLDSERSENVFHLQNPRPLTWSGYLRPLERFGYALTLEDPERWRKRLPAIDESNALFDVVAFYLDDAQDIGDMSRIDCARTSSTLARLGVRYPEKDASLLDNHFRFLIESGFLPPLVHRPTQQQADHVRDEAPQSA